MTQQIGRFLSRIGNTLSRESEPNGDRNSSSESPTNGGVSSSSVREFLYLDTPKIYSYLSQMEGGLRLLIERVENEYKSSRLDPGTRETIIRVATSAVVKGAIPFLGGAEGTGDFERTRKTVEGGEVTTTSSHAGRTDLSVLHHKAFDIVLNGIGGRLKQVDGALSLLAISKMPELVKTLASQKSINARDENGASRRFAGDMARLDIEQIVYCGREPSQLLALTLTEHFTVPPLHIPLIYGIPSSQNFTLVGLPGRDVMSGEAPVMRARTDAETMFLFLDQTIRNTDSYLAEYGLWVYPLAIYRDL